MVNRHCLAQAPSTLTIEPAKLAPGNTHAILAGEAIPESKVAVGNAAGQLGLVKAYLGGQKTPLAIVQRLWRLKEGQGVLVWVCIAAVGDAGQLFSGSMCCCCCCCCCC